PCCVHRASVSFPTRRSSDLGKDRKFAAEGATTSEKTGRRTDDAGSCAETGNVDNAIAKKMRGNDLMASSPRRRLPAPDTADTRQDRKSTRLNSSHVKISYAV